MPTSKDSRRAQVLALIEAGGTPQDVAKKMKISASTVYSQLRRSGRSVRNLRLPATAFHILADLLNTADTQAVISKRHGISQQRVYNVALAARRAGIKLPSRRR